MVDGNHPEYHYNDNEDIIIETQEIIVNEEDLFDYDSVNNGNAPPIPVDLLPFTHVVKTINFSSTPPPDYTAINAEFEVIVFEIQTDVAILVNTISYNVDEVINENLRAFILAQLPPIKLYRISEEIRVPAIVEAQVQLIFRYYTNLKVDILQKITSMLM